VLDKLIKLRGLIKEAEAIYDSPIRADRKYSVLFAHFGDSISPILDQCGVDFDYYDPDSSYEEDTYALMDALRGVQQDIEQMIKSIEIRSF
jgi:hypothetical protein